MTTIQTSDPQATQVSNAQWLNGLGSTNSASPNPMAQTLLQMMDSNGNGTVSADEFTVIENAFSIAEKLPTTGAI